MPGRRQAGNGAGRQRARVALADDDALLRAGLASLLERSGYEIAGEAGDGEALLSIVRTEHPDAVVVDIRMPPTFTSEGLDAARVIRTELPDVAILVLSNYLGFEDASEAIANGRGTGYLLKSRVADPADFIEAIDRILRGGCVVDPGLVQELVDSRRSRDPVDELTARERDVLAQMAEGRSNAGIGRALWITESTVEKHVRSILAKLHLPEGDDDHRRVLAVLAYLGHVTGPREDGG